VVAALRELQDLHHARRRHTGLRGGAFLRRRRPPQHQQLADVLHRRCVQPIGQLRQRRFAGFARVAEHAHLDQPVRLQRRVGFAQHRVGEAVAADHHHRVEMVRMTALFLAFGGAQGKGSHASIIAVPAHGGWP
jgi:hypothetical protein